MDLSKVSFIPSRWFTALPAGRRSDLVVVHTVEGDPDIPSTVADEGAEAVARYCARRDDKVSAHWFVDDDSIVRGVKDKDVAYAAPGANHNGIQIELCGWARWTREQWLGEHIGTLCNLAHLMVHYWRANQVLLAYVDEHGLAKGHRGITTHHDVTQAFKRSTHTDPGPGFPLHDVIQLAWHLLLAEDQEAAA